MDEVISYDSDDLKMDFGNIRKWDLMRLAVEIINGTFKFFDIKREIKKMGRKPWNLKGMITIIFFGGLEGIISSNKISDRAESDRNYRLLSKKTTPNERTIRDYNGIYQEIYKLILSYTLIIAQNLGLSNFKHLSVDGTIKLACNSPFNIMKQEDIHLLIKHYMVQYLTKKEIESLRKSARKFLFNKKLSAEEKINILLEWYDKLELTGQTSISLHDPDARLMNIKDKGQKYKKFAYNVQVITDTKSKMICGVLVVQSPTDHYQLPEIVEQGIENLQMKPDIISADCIYGTISNLFYLKQKGISVRIPTSKQSNEAIGKKSENKYSIEYFVFDENKNVFICPEKQELTQDGIYNAPMEKGGFNKKKIIYSNYKTCKNCPCKTKCTKSQHRTITRYVHELSLEAEKIMNTEKGKKDYQLRSRTVEAHNGTFIRVYHYDRLQVVGLEETQEVMFKIAATYNTIRLFNIIEENGVDLSYVINTIRTISSKI